MEATIPSLQIAQKAENIRGIFRTTVRGKSFVVCPLKSVVVNMQGIYAFDWQVTCLCALTIGSSAVDSVCYVASTPASNKAARVSCGDRALMMESPPPLPL
jgi:hypothetical protein